MISAELSGTFATGLRVFPDLGGPGQLVLGQPFVAAQELDGGSQRGGELHDGCVSSGALGCP